MYHFLIIFMGSDNFNWQSKAMTNWYMTNLTIYLRIKRLHRRMGFPQIPPALTNDEQDGRRRACRHIARCL